MILVGDILGVCVHNSGCDAKLFDLRENIVRMRINLSSFRLVQYILYVVGVPRVIKRPRRILTLGMTTPITAFTALIDVAEDEQVSNISECTDHD